MKRTPIACFVGLALLTGCQGIPKNVPTVVVPPPKSSPYADRYPETRDHQEKLDSFLNGEYDRPAGVLQNGIFITTADRVRPDDGIDNYPTERIVDRFRWLENVDTIDPKYSSDPIYGQDKEAARQRNFLGSRLEDPTLDNFDGRAHTALQKPNPNPPKSEVTQWVEAQQDLTMNYLRSVPYYDEIKSRIDDMWNVEYNYSEKFYKGVGYIKIYRDKQGVKRVSLTDLNGNTREIINEYTVGENRLATTRFDRGTVPKVNKDGKYIAYSLTQSSADADEDARVLYIMEIATGKIVHTIESVAVDSVSWDENPNTFVYRRLVPNNSYVVYRHDMSKNRLNDEILVNGYEEVGLRIDDVVGFYGEGKDKDRYLVMEVALSIPSTVIKDMKTGYVWRLDDIAYFKKDNTPFGRSYSYAARFVHFDPKTLDVWFISTENSPKAQILKSNLKNLKKREVVFDPVAYDFLDSAEFHDEGDGYFIVVVGKDVAHKVLLVDHKGVAIKELTPSPLGAASKLKSHTVDKDDDKDK